jgi:arylsulfatase A-like enzyme
MPLDEYPAGTQFPGVINRTADESSPIAAPNLDKAAKGLRYRNMHTTALCSPARSCITGRDHDANRMACITEAAIGSQGYNWLVPFKNGFLGGDTSQWDHDLVHDEYQVEPPRTPEGYHLTEDLADKAIEFICEFEAIKTKALA